ncbi:lipoprotein [Enterobacterales bacterium]|nr:lipoprotein [Enterobacterales bacterium]
MVIPVPRYILLWLFIPILLCSGCTHFANDRWTGKDKAEHFAASAIMAAAGTAYGEHQGWNDAQSRSFGLLFSIGLGAGKELYDSREAGTGWSWKDFAWDVAGAAAGYGAYQVIHH